MHMLAAVIRPALVLFASMSVVTGFLYPLVVTGIGKAVFPAQAAGSLMEEEGKVVGSTLIGQHFSAPKYFWGRPSATGPVPYNAAASSGSNQGPLNPALLDAVRAADPENQSPVPVDLVTASGSGLDPHISVAAANYQLSRVARARGLTVAMVESLVAEHTEERLLGFLGEPRVNVLLLNRALDGQAQAR
jgi:potassium-transporting ATPase KdpC subunit